MLRPAVTMPTLSEVAQHFAAPPADCRIMMRWWWFGPVAEEAELLREMLAMRDAGIGGFEISVVYPLAMDDPDSGLRNYRYLSETFLSRIHFVSVKALELDLRMDVTIGSGWSFGGPHIGADLAAAQLRCEARTLVNRDSLPRPVPYENETLVAALVGVGSKLEMPSTFEVIDLSGDGDIVLPPLEGARVVLFYIASKTGQVVKRAAYGAEGYILDHFKRAAVEKHLTEVADRILDAAEPGAIHALFCDSLEVYDANWTDDILAEFERRCGYDLRPFLPMLDAELGERWREVRRDFGRTLSELYEDNFLKPVRAWADRRNIRFRMQNYGIPPTPLSSYRHIDLIEGESWGWPGLPETKWAASAAHLLGSAVTSSETWTWSHSPVFRATPLDLKGEADQHFLLGINQLIGHGWPYSPPQAAAPGWALYAAAALTDANPWWPAMPALSRYLQRVSYVLRQGEPVADVAVYAPTEDAWSSFRPGKPMYLNLWGSIRDHIGGAIPAAIAAAGHDFDLFDDGLLAEAAKRRYACIVLPNVRFLPKETDAWLRRFIAEGGLLLATGRRPEGDWHDVELIGEAALADRLAWALPASLAFREPQPAVGFVRRRLADADVFFIANTGATPVATEARFGSAYGAAEIWDPIEGVVQAASFPTVPVCLPPYGSMIVVLSDGAARGATVRTEARHSVALASNWSLEVAGHPARSVALPHSWADEPDLATHSGVARYRIVVPWTRALAADERIVLDFGAAEAASPESGKVDPMRGKSFAAQITPPIREAATIHVNGRRVGVLWTPPYALDVTEAWRVGENELIVEVYNTAVNQLSATGLPDMERLVSRFGRRARFQDTDKLRPLPSGILGVPRIEARGLI